MADDGASNSSADDGRTEEGEERRGEGGKMKKEGGRRKEEGWDAFKTRTHQSRIVVGTNDFRCVLVRGQRELAENGLKVGLSMESKM